MTFAFGHLVGAWLVGKTYEYFSKKKISHYTWFFLLFGSILPDFDYIIHWTFNLQIHRTFTHSLIFVIVAPLITYLIFFKHKGKKNFAIFLSVGILTHILLDMATSSMGVPLFWPNILYFSFTNIGTFNPANPSFLGGDVSSLSRSLKHAIVDMAIGTTWIFYLWFRKRIKF